MRQPSKLFNVGSIPIARSITFSTASIATAAAGRLPRPARPQGLAYILAAACARKRLGQRCGLPRWRFGQVSSLRQPNGDTDEKCSPVPAFPECGRDAGHNSQQGKDVENCFHGAAFCVVALASSAVVSGLGRAVMVDNAPIVS